MYFYFFSLASVVYSQTKLESLQSLSQQTSIIRLNKDTFKQYASEPSRSYTIVVLFTTVTYESQCPACYKLRLIYEKLVYSYINTPVQEKNKPVFFGILEYEKDTHEYFQKAGFNNLPGIYVSFKPTETSKLSKIVQYNDEDEATIESVFSFVNERTGRKVKLLHSFVDIIVPWLVTIGGVAVAALVVGTIAYFFFNPLLWWVCGMIIYFFCNAGMVYNVIHGTPFTGFNEEGKVVLIASGPRNQYVLEGLVMSFLICGAGCSLITLNIISKLKSPWLIRIIGSICLGTFIACAFQVLKIYKEKASWYNPTFEPPGQYIKGPLINDQGNSF